MPRLARAIDHRWGAHGLAGSNDADGSVDDLSEDTTFGGKPPDSSGKSPLSDPALSTGWISWPTHLRKTTTTASASLGLIQSVIWRAQSSTRPSVCRPKGIILSTMRRLIDCTKAGADAALDTTRGPVATEPVANVRKLLPCSGERPGSHGEAPLAHLLIT